MATTQYIEDHPIFHNWYINHDYVTQRNSRRRIIEIKRVQECERCPTTKVTYIDVASWRPNRHPQYKYVKGVVIVRVTKASFNRQQFLATTDLPQEDRDALAAMKLESV